jgi:mannose-1-phosphate guanylyltransferase/mannose-6-phosphate isomerase
MSRQFYPKQFHHLTGDCTMLQQTARRIEGLCVPRDLMLIGNREHRTMMLEQMAECGWQDASVMLEPVGRNTAPAIAVAALAAMEEDPDAVLLVLPADHVIHDEAGFRRTVKEGVDLARQGYLITFGIVADRPDTGFGYIRRGSPLMQGAFKVETFVEKPDQEHASEYLSSGDYFWNSGMFMFTAKSYLEELQKFQPQVHAHSRRAWADRDARFYEYTVFGAAAFEACPSISIDYAVMEQTDRAAMLPLDVGWNDVGSWSALYRELPHDEAGNATKGDVIADQTADCLLYAHDRLLATQGIKDLVIVETADAVLVSDMKSSQRTGELAKQLQSLGREQASCHKRVYRPWGSYTVLEQGVNHQVKRLRLKPGAILSLQRHQHRSEHWVVVKGEASVVRGEDRLSLKENESVYIPAGTIHQLANMTDVDLGIIEVQTGSYLGEDDIERIDDPYHRGGTAG